MLKTEPAVPSRPRPAEGGAAGEIFTPDQLEAHAARIAATHDLTPNPRRGRPLLPRLHDSAARLEAAYQFLLTTAKNGAVAVGSEDWLRDNYHVVQDQVREIRQHLPRRYYQELPKLASGPFAGYPRIYLLARELVSHTAGRIDLGTIVDFTRAYQRASQLSIGETWAIPLMLRLALVEELRRLDDRVVEARRGREKARRWHVQLAEKDWNDRLMAQLLEDARGPDGRLSPGFVVEFLQWLRDQPLTAAPAWHALHRALEAQEDSADEMLRLEHQREAADQLAIGNLITTMRLVSAIDWTLFFERVNVVEEALRKDPSGAYSLMEFSTRDRYRHSVEQLAKRAQRTETSVANAAVSLSLSAMREDPEHDRRHHVGYYLISRGRFQLERTIGYRPTLRERVSRFTFKHPAVMYLGQAVAATTAGLVSVLLYSARHDASPALLWLVALVALVPVSELMISVVNLLATSAVPPRLLPKMALKQGIPAEYRTIAVVPAIIDSVARVRSLIDDLEVRFLGNRDDHLHFALLSDFADANEASREGDDELVTHARLMIDQLNERYGAGRFYFFHRERRWNPGERRWMGWERKRGKLAEFNRLLRGASDTSFVVTHGDTSMLPSVRFVITLDSDTQLPMEAARRLVGTLAHPLNRPRFDPAKGRVTEGYGVIQPRIGVNLVSANRTTFAKVFSGHVGIDPYTTAVSDVYQDLFHEGSYVGKGIYDVDAFEAALAGRIPENTLLSHDLFEGFYARTGLVTDVHLVDDYPATYLAYTARQHRWVRGDWQIARWLWPTVPDASGRPVRNTLPSISRWKILDNLRRSLLPPALIVLLIAGWTILPGSSAFWTVFAFMVLAFPAYVQVGRSLSSRTRGVPLTQHFAAERDNILTSARQAFFSVVFLAHQGWLMADAIGRTIWRLYLTRRPMLEWVSAERFRAIRPSPVQLLRSMWAAPAIATGVAIAVGLVDATRLLFMLPLIGLWGLSPLIAYVTGRPILRERERLEEGDRAKLRKVARLTWRYFEELFAPADHWLIPDNYQEDREDVIAHRTSPTNIGLQLLSTLAARDFGYLSTAGVVDRLEPTFGTLLTMHRYRGHFYNWYDTRTLEPLSPTYISTVDSGNFAGFLLTLKGGLDRLVDAEPIIDTRALAGIQDAIALFADSLDGSTNRVAARAIAQELTTLRALLAGHPDTLARWRRLVDTVGDQLATVGVLFHEIEDASGDTGMAEASVWIDRAATDVAQWQADLDRFAPWALSLETSPHGVSGPIGVPSLARLVEWSANASAALEHVDDAGALRAAIDRSHALAEELVDRIVRLGGLADDLIEETEFGFLFNRERQLFSIGFSVTDGRLDMSYYDTMASEARLASYLAIALGQVSHEHWFKLGRSLTPTGTARALLSWSASMFEYFMPLLVMRAYPDTLLDETYRAVLQRQIEYAAQHRVPWGISESAYNAQDLERNYQYRAFGVPGLGLKRGLGDDLVIAPYASMLAAQLAPVTVLRNLQHLAREGLAGRYGFYEAIDYTQARVPEGAGRGVVLPTFMAHHQGMSLLALDNALNDLPMQHRFHADPRVQAADLLLQERIPHQVPLKNPPIEVADHVPSARVPSAPAVRRYTTPHTLSPRPHLLSNGSYVVMVTNAGGGYSRRQQTAMTRWREDVTADGWGSFCYVRDLDSGEYWSTTHQPTGREADQYEATFAPDRAVFRRVDGGIETRTEIVVSPEDDAELRRVSVTNHGDKPRRLDLTSYAEVVLAPGDADLSHPAFSNLFVETRSVGDRDALMAVRRPRAGKDRRYLVHVLSGRGRGGAPTQHETDRRRFVGRGGTLDRPLAMSGSAPLSNTTGPVLDPIVSLRLAVRLPPGATARVAFTTGYAESEEAARLLIEKYYDRRAVARALALASTHSQIELRHLGLTIDQTMAFQRLGGRLISGDARLREVEAIQENRRGQQELWKHGISGDLPIVVVRLTDDTGLPLVAELLKGHEYLRLKGLPFDLVVLNEHPASYLQNLQDELQRMVESGPELPWMDKPGGVFLRRADLMPREDQLLLRAVARAVMDAADGSLASQLAKPQVPFVPGATRTALSDPATYVVSAPASAVAPEANGLEMFNGLGGFAAEGHEYVVVTGDAQPGLPPVPWTNVVAVENFGFACTESGPGYTWSGNSHDNRLTPWRNDPVSDQPGEAMFIRDERTGAFWSATPLPAGGGRRYVVRHGQGYSTYEHARDEVASKLTLFVPRNAAVKIFRLSLKNTTPVRRRISVTLYVDWVLGENRSRTSLHVVTGVEPGTGALTARNAFRPAFGDRLAFLDLSPGDSRTLTGDRTEFLGRNGSLRRPSALGREELSGRTGAAYDPCGAIQIHVDLGPSEERLFVGQLGEANDEGAVRAMVTRFRDPAAVDAALREIQSFWDALLGTVTVRTPDRAMDVMLNRWLPYQTLACRVWGRSAFYQSSGAFGFRDQLQDTAALVAADPTILREQLLRAASRQFVEGDVQHWWHEPGGQGVRTRFSDDRLWMVYAALHYAQTTGDAGIFDAVAPFLTARLLNPDEHEVYERPEVSAESASLYDHCVRAIELSLGTGEHGLPLMGTGDWNDGMNLVGAAGKGESVWLAWFLISLLQPFADVAEARGESARAIIYRRHAGKLAAAAEQSWDGDWYRRAYFDDGTPLGSKDSPECRIDAIAQSWAVISGAASADHARRAMASVEEHLVRPADRIVLLLAPPFDRMEPSPGYIQGYLPGVRENGGQYTHAALWNVLAFARLGDGDRAAAMFALLNPVNHGRTPEDVARYGAEPYALAADVYSVVPHVGRGGWTWYTGSAGWMYRIGIEAILGITLRHGALHVDPCIPRGWPGFEAVFRRSATSYRIVVENPDQVNAGVARLEVDGTDRTGHDVPLLDDGATHLVRVVLGVPATSPRP